MFYRWIDQPYSIRVKPGGLVEYWEHSVNPYSERVTVPLAATGFFTIQGMADSTWCLSSAPNRYQTLSLDSISPTTAKAKLLAGASGFGLREGTGVTFTYDGDTLVISASGGGSGTVTDVSSGNLSPLFNVTVTNPTTTPAFSFAQINQNANLVFAGPATGAAAAPTFRALVAADIPAGIALWTDAGAFTYLTATTDRALVGSATEINSSYIFQAKGGAFIQGAGSTSATFALVAEKADGTDILNVRNDGRVGILNSAPAYTLDVIGDIAINQTSAYYLENTKMAYGKPANHNYYFGGAGNVTGNATKNIAIGTSALLSLGATGGFNVAIGFEAGKLITTGQGNTAIGTQALATNTVGNNNFALGTEALKLNTASNNVAVGGLSQPSTSTGDKNVSLGYFTLNGNTTGFENVAIGNVALQLNSDGYRNIGIGSEALLSNVSGFGNIAIGNSALYSTTGSRNTVIGYASGLFLTTGSQNIVIGASLRPINDAGSNQMTIGNIIYATGVDGTGTTVSTGNVGIKTNAPSQALHVSGNLRVTGAYYDSNNDPGTAGQILSTTATGTDWIAAPSAPTIVTANNALTLTGTNLQWGGALVQNTTVDQDGFWQLHKDGRKEFFRYNTGNPFTDVNVTGTVDITGKAADPSINPTPSEDNILTIRGHNGTSTYYANAMFFGTYTTAAYGSWIQTRSESAYTTYYPLNINVNGGKVGIGRDPNTDQLNAHVTISRSLTGSTIDGILLHIENTEGNKTAMSWGHGYDNIDGEIGYFDTEGVFRMTNRNTGTGETIRFAIGGETTDRAVMLPSTAASKVRFGVGFNNTTDLTSTLLSKGSLGAAALSTSGAPTFDETKFFVVYTAAGAQTYTLPAQTDCKGRIFWIQNNSSAGTITLSVAVKKANGATFNTLAPGEFCQFISDGADYWGYKQTSL